MAGATNTTLGTIKLAGDFIGGHAEAPALRPSGVKADTYNITDKVYVDAQGRITWAKQLPEDFEWPEGSKTQDGIVQIGVLPDPNNKSIDVDANSVISLNKATTSDAGVAKLGNGLAKNVGSGATDIVVPDASTSVFGYARPDNNSMQVNNDGVISVDGSWAINQVGPATTTTTGGVKVGDHFAIDGAGDLSTNIPNAAASVKGLMQIGAGFTYEGATISVPKATSSVKGIFKPIQPNFYIDTDFSKLYLHNCASPYFGNPEGLIGLVAGVSGPYMSIDWPTSTISCSYNFSEFSTDATTTAKGKAQVGDRIDVNSGVISLPDPTDTIYGPVKVTGRSFKVSGDGALYWDTSYYANATYAGHVRPDGTTIKFSDQANAVISFDPADTPVATTTSKGIVQVGSGFNVSSGVISVPEATPTVLGAVQLGTGIGTFIDVPYLIENRSATADLRGVISVESIDSGLVINAGQIDLATATANEFGSFFIGDDGFTVSDAVMSYTPSPATDTTYGSFTADGSTLSIVTDAVNNSPVLRNNSILATNTTYGIVKPGEYFEVGSPQYPDPGILNLRKATTGSKGVITIQDSDNGLTLSEGVFNLANASKLRKGIMKVGYGLSNDWDGVVSTNFKSAKFNVVNKYKKSQLTPINQLVGLQSIITSNDILNSTHMVFDPVNANVDTHTITIQSSNSSWTIQDSKIRIFYKVKYKSGTTTPIRLTVVNSSGTSTSGEIGAGLTEDNIVMIEFIKLPEWGSLYAADVVFDKYTVY